MRISQINKSQNPKNNLIKYLNPSKIIINKGSKNINNNNLSRNIHCRSMQELDLNQKYSSEIINKQNKRNIHYSSLYQNQNTQLNHMQEPETQKSKSMSKFMALFENSNILNTKNKENKQNSCHNDNKNISKRQKYNGFSYDLKISANSSNTQHKIIKKKQNPQTNNNINQVIKSQRDLKQLQTNKSTIQLNKSIHQRHNQSLQLINQNNYQNQTNLNINNSQIFIKMKEVMMEQKLKQNKLHEKLKHLEEKHKMMQNQINNFNLKILNYNHTEKDYQDKIQTLEQKNHELKQKIQKLTKKNQKISENKQCKQHNSVIRSLKKVISEQLNKIIELQRFKIDNLSQNDQKQDFYEQDQYQKNNFIQSSRSSKNSTLKHKKKNSIQKIDFFVDEIKQNFKKSLKHSMHAEISQPEQLSPNVNHRLNYKNCFFVDEGQNEQQSHDKYLYNPTILHPNRQRSNMIKIRQSEQSFSNDAIQEVTEENQNQEAQHQQNFSIQQDKHQDNEKDEHEDQILNQVDEYLSKWRNN